MKINEAEQEVGITRKNIRFYEQQGLLNPSRNLSNGYREYSSEDILILRRIKLLRKLGIPTGHAKLIGISTHSTKITLEAVKSGKIEVLMFPVNPLFNLLPQDTADARMKGREIREMKAVSAARHSHSLSHDPENNAQALFAGFLLTRNHERASA